MLINSVAAFAGVLSHSGGIAIMTAFVIHILSGVLETRTLLLFPIWDSALYHRFLDALYYLIPQVSGMSKNASYIVGALPKNTGSFDMMPFVYSTLSAAFFYFLALQLFSKRDY